MTGRFSTSVGTTRTGARRSGARLPRQRTPSPAPGASSPCHGRAVWAGVPLSGAWRGGVGPNHAHGLGHQGMGERGDVRRPVESDHRRTLGDPTPQAVEVPDGVQLGPFQRRRRRIGDGVRVEERDEPVRLMQERPTGSQELRVRIPLRGPAYGVHGAPPLDLPRFRTPPTRRRGTLGRQRARRQPRVPWADLARRSDGGIPSWHALDRHWGSVGQLPPAELARVPGRVRLAGDDVARFHAEGKRDSEHNPRFPGQGPRRLRTVRGPPTGIRFPGGPQPYPGPRLRGSEPRCRLRSGGT